MASWQELTEKLSELIEVLDGDKQHISLAVHWDNGRSQKVNVDRLEFGEQQIASVTSPVIPYSREAADFLFTNFSVPLEYTETDGFLSISYSLHFETMPVESCVVAIMRVAELADGVESSITGGGDHSIGASATPSPSQEEQLAQDTGVIGSGQYLVGSEIAPGFYRYAGYIARLDDSGGIIANDNSRAGLGLVKVSPNDSYFEVSGEAIRLEDHPTFDVLGLAPRGGIYLVGTDLPQGKYRIHGEGTSAYYAIYDKNMTRLSNDLNKGSLILSVPASAFAVEYHGRLESLK